jgi:hypothetical protein
MQNAIDYYTDLALLKFKKSFFHAERNLLAAGKESDPAVSATEAMWKTRDEIISLVKLDPEIQDDVNREHVWSRALYYVTYIRTLLVDLKNLHPSIVPQHHVEQLGGVSYKVSTPNADTIVEVLEKGIEDRLENRLEHRNGAKGDAGKPE